MMNDFHLYFRGRDFGDVLQPDGVTLAIQSYSKHVVGGPRRAVVHATGELPALLALLSRLREPVDIISPRGKVWWGYVHSVKVQAGADVLGRSLDAMYNRVQVAYTAPTASGSTVRGTTGWEDNEESQNKYGFKEKIASLSDAAPSLAEAFRDTLLAQESEPGATMDLADAKTPGATLELRGWWDTLAWQHYQQEVGIEEHSASAEIKQKIGQGPATGVGFLAIEGGVDEDDIFHIYHIGGDLIGFEPDDRIVVFGAATFGNNKTYTVVEEAKRDARSYTNTTIGFATYTDSNDEPIYLVLDFLGSPSHNLPEGEVLKVAGSTSNDGYRLILKNERRLLRTLTAATVGFATHTNSNDEPVYLLMEFAGGLQDILAGEFIGISGAGESANNGLKRVLANAKRASRTTTIASIGFKESTGSDNEPIYELLEFAGGLQDILQDEYIWIGGAVTGGNNGLKLVKSNAERASRTRTAATIGFRTYTDASTKKSTYFLFDLGAGLQDIVQDEWIWIGGAATGGEQRDIQGEGERSEDCSIGSRQHDRL